MKYLTSSVIALAFAGAAFQAQAQDAAQAPPPAAPAPDAASAAPSAATTVSDSEVDTFAKATVAAQKINADTSLDEAAKQAKMADAVKSAGIEPARFNEIGKAVTTDTALRAKVQTAMAKYSEPPKG